RRVALDGGVSMEAADLRQGRKSGANRCTGLQAHVVRDLARQVPREVVGRPANEPAPEAVELLAEPLETPPGLLQLAIDLGDMASPRLGHWAEQGVDIMARPWPQGGTLFTQDDFTCDFAPGQGTCPGGQTGPMLPGTNVPFPASACEVCPQRAPCPTARRGQGRSLYSREDAQFQPKLRAQMKTQRVRAA